MLLERTLAEDERRGGSPPRPPLSSPFDGTKFFDCEILDGSRSSLTLAYPIICAALGAPKLPAE